MKKDTILEVFGYLKSKQLVSGESEFSEHWLGCSEGYMRKLRHKKKSPVWAQSQYVRVDCRMPLSSLKCSHAISH